MSADDVLLVLAPVFAVLAVRRTFRNRGRVDGAARAWFVVALVFVAVGGWLRFHAASA